MDLCANRGRVDIEDACVKVAHCGKRAVDVERIDRSGQAVLDAVADRDGFLQGTARDDRHDGAEDFFLRDTHRWIDIRKNRRFVKEALRTGAGLEPCTAAGQRGALPLADFHVLYDGPALRVADQWADLGRGIEPVTNPQRSGTRNESIQKSSIHLFMDDNPTGRGAPLSGRAKTAPQAA